MAVFNQILLCILYQLWAP